MGSIRISKETLDEIKNSQEDESIALALSKFDPDRQIIAKQPKTLDSAVAQICDANAPGTRKSRKRLAHELHELRQAYGIGMPSNHKSAKAKKKAQKKLRSSERHLIKKEIRIEMEKKNLERVRKISASATPTAHLNIYAPVLANHSPARRKSERQDISSVVSLQRELSNLRAMKNDDPNALDRAAMK